MRVAWVWASRTSTRSSTCLDRGSSIPWASSTRSWRSSSDSAGHFRSSFWTSSASRRSARSSTSCTSSRRGDRNRAGVPELELSLLDADDPRVAQVEQLFQKMYEYQGRHGLMMPLAPGGAARWLAGVQAGLGRFGCLVLASDGARAIGFLHAGLHAVPDYLGGGRGGRITHVYVLPEAQGMGLGRRLVETAIEWLRDRD